MKKNIYLIKKVSQKEGREPFTYIQLYVDLGYDKLVLSMDKNLIAQLLDCPVSDLFAIEIDQPVNVAYIDKAV